DTVEEAPLVERTVGTAFAAGAIVRHHDDQGVVELAGVLEVVEDPTELVIGIGDEAGEHLRHAGEEALLVVTQRVPRTDGVEDRPRLAIRTGSRWLAVRVDGRELGVLREQAERLLSLEDASPDRLVSAVELPLVLVGPLLEDAVRRV